jgi:transposase
VPESWIPPGYVLDARALVRLYKDLIDERTGWLQRVHATLLHHGVPAVAGSLMTAAGRERVASADLPAAGRYAVDAGMRQVARLADEMLPLRRQIVALGTRQPGCQALQAHYGIGALLSVAIWEELGDCRRFTSSDDAVRHTGLDVTVWSSDNKRTRGHLAKQGPPVLRWALYEAAVYASRPTLPRPCRVSPAAPTPRGTPGVEHPGPQAGTPLLPHAEKRRRSRVPGSRLSSLDRPAAAVRPSKR